MKADSSVIDKEALLSLLQMAYGVEVARLEFVPKGEESYNYIATTNTGQKYFVKVHLMSISPELEANYQFVHQLCTTSGYAWATSAYPTTEGKSLARLGEYAVALFDYVEGVTKAPKEFSGEPMEQLAALIVELHHSVPVALSSGLAQESYAIPFKAWLMEVLEAVDQPLRKESVWSQWAYDLIRTEKPQILAALAYTEEITTVLQTTEQRQAVTHGDLASHNIIQDEHGALFLIDWSKLRIAPAARDLVALWEEGNVLLLSAYFRAAGEEFNLSKEAVAYYLYHNLLAMITDYGSWLILEDVSQEEAEHAWERLQQVLPLDTEKIQRKVEAICSVATSV